MIPHVGSADPTERGPWARTGRGIARRPRMILDVGERVWWSHRLARRAAAEHRHPEPVSPAHPPR